MKRILLILVLFFISSSVWALCGDEQRLKARLLVQEASQLSDKIDQILLLKRSLKVCTNFTAWLELGKTELELDNPFAAVYALENARDMYVSREGIARSAGSILRQAIANGWLAEAYHLENELALAVVAIQEAAVGFDSVGQKTPARLVSLQASLDDDLAKADSSVLARSLSVQHSRTSRGIGVRTKIEKEDERMETQIETAELLEDYSGESSSVTQIAESASSVASNTSSTSEALPTAGRTESRLNIPVLFEFDSDQLSSTSLGTVVQLAAAIEALSLDSQATVLIIGHTDSQGSEAYNFALSVRRADEVLRQINKTTDTTAKLVSSGRGETQLRYLGDSSDDHRRNRRVELVIQR